MVGCPRSGTTLVQAMIARHPDVFSLGETCFFRAMLGDLELRWGDLGAHSDRHWYHRAGLARSSGRRLLRELEQLHFKHTRRKRLPRSWSACARRYVGLLDAASSREGRSHWVEKTPDHLLYLDEIAARVPDAKFVHVLRNGMDVIASLTDADMHYQNTAGFRGGIVQWSKRWNHAVELHLARLGRPHNHVICLEDLIADPCEEWKRLRDFLDLGRKKKGFAVATRQRRRRHGVRALENAAFSGVARSPHGKVTALFGPQPVTWLRHHLVSYETVRDAVREQHHTNPAELEPRGEPAARRSAAARKPGGPRRTVERRVRSL